MVNRGKPSKDCLPCRRRKLRCDLQPDGCGQCRRAGIDCHGYRDPTQITIHDETNKVIRKNVSVPFPGTMQLSQDARARMAFFNCYLSGVTHMHNCLTSLLERPVVESHLTQSVDAVSLAFLASQQRQPSLASLANRRYLSAVQQINNILRSQNQDAIRSDATLQSVLLLDMFDKFMSNSDNYHSGLHPWSIHLNGALSLVELRGCHNFKTDNARKLAMRVANWLNIVCNANSTPPPEMLNRLYANLEPFGTLGDIKFIVKDVITDLIRLKADIIHARFPTVDAVLQASYAVETKFAAMEEHLYQVWPRDHVWLDDENPLVFGQYYEVYQNYFFTQAWNIFRAMRMMLHEIIQTYSAQVLGTPDETSCALVEKVAREVCASIPELILVQGRDGNALPLTPLQTLQCQAMLPPLYCAAKCSSDPRLHLWVIEIMKYMAEAGGMKTAMDISKLLESSSTASYWQIYLSLGGYVFAP